MLALQGSDVTVDDARNRYTDITKTEQKGVTVALTGMAGSMIEAAHELKQAAESDEDNRMKSLRAHGQQGHGDLNVQGSALKAGHDVSLDAARDMSLTSAQNVTTLKGSNKSGGGSLGVSVGSNGLTVDVAANAGLGKEKGNSVSHVETTVDAGHDVALNTSRDALLQGAQVNGERIDAAIGRNLTLRSEQDEDEYKSSQVNVSGGVSAGLGGGAQGSASMSNMDSTFHSVKEQTGLFAGTGGYNVNVGDHTQLDAAVIGSRAEADRNRLETGTLGFSNLENQLHFKVQQAGISGGTGMSGAQTAMSAAASVVAALSGNNGDDRSTTHAAVSDGTLIVRDHDHQQQNVGELSRDVEHAANALTPMFDKAKEQQRLQRLQLAQTVVNQAVSIGVTYGEQQAHDATSQDANAQAQATAEANQHVKESSWLDSFGYYSQDQQHQAAYDQALKNTTAYQNTLKGYGLGSQTHTLIESGANLVTGLLAGNGKGAVASAAAPFLAQGVKHLTTGDQSGEQLSAGEIAGNALGHAVAGGVVADVSSGNAKAGAAGAAAGELAAHAAARIIADGKSTQDLTQREREQISQWGQVAGGVAGGLAGGGKNYAAEIGTGAQAGKNAVENNFIFFTPVAVPVAISIWDVIIGAMAAGTTTVLVNQVVDSIDTRPSYIPEETSADKLEMSRPEAEKISSTAGPRPEVEPIMALPGGHKEEVSGELINYGHSDFAKLDPYTAPQHRPEPTIPVLDNPIHQPTIEDIALYAKDPVKALEVSSYKDLRDRAIVGDNLEHDHIPSYAAIRKAAEINLGRKLNREEAKKLYENATAIEVPRDIHIKGRTYGGKNTQDQILSDTKDLCGAQCLDLEVHRVNLEKAGYSKEEIIKAIQAVKDRNYNIIE